MNLLKPEKQFILININGDIMNDFMSKLGLQLWSVKDSMENDVEATLKAVSELGFIGVEFAGFFDKSADEMKSLLDKYNLKVAGSHTGPDLLFNNPQEVIEYNTAIGNHNIVCPHYDLKDEVSLEKLIGEFERVYPVYKNAGMKLYYHNHNHEFFKIGDRYALDILFERLPFLNPQIDTYWVCNADVDVESFCMQYKCRCNLIHLKDGTKTTSTSVGDGEIDIKNILDICEKINAEWIIVEDESWSPSGLESVKAGINYLKNI